MLHHNRPCESLVVSGSGFYFIINTAESWEKNGGDFTWVGHITEASLYNGELFTSGSLWLFSCFRHDEYKAFGKIWFCTSTFQQSCIISLIYLVLINKELELDSIQYIIMKNLFACIDWWEHFKGTNPVLSKAQRMHESWWLTES